MITKDLVAAALFEAGFRRHRPNENEGYRVTQERKRTSTGGGSSIYHPIGPVKVEFRPKFEGVVRPLIEDMRLDMFSTVFRQNRPKWKVRRYPNYLEVSDEV